MAREQSWCALGWSQCSSEILPLGSALSKPNPVVRIYVRCRTRDPSTLILCLVLFWCQQLIKQRLSWLRKVEEWPPCSSHSHTLKHTIYRDSSKRIWSPMGWKQETNDMAGCLKLSGRWNSPYSLYSDQRCSVQPVCYTRIEKKRTKQTQQAQGRAYVNPQITLQTPQTGHRLNKGRGRFESVSVKKHIHELNQEETLTSSSQVQLWRSKVLEQEKCFNINTDPKSFHAFILADTSISHGCERYVHPRGQRNVFLRP